MCVCVLACFLTSVCVLLLKNKTEESSVACPSSSMREPVRGPRRRGAWFPGGPLP